MDALHPIMVEALRAFAPPPPKPQPTPEQQLAINQFKAKYGQFWKEELATKWWSGRDVNEPHGALLRQVRNQLGPQWLARQ